MINLLLGQPGGGKSYESVAFHILPAVVEHGRKVITNLPLRLDMWEHFFPGSSKLIEIRGNYQFDGKLCRPFTRAEDFGDPWRGENDLGALYVIDECHKFFPRVGTSVAVEEWFAEHRHEGADVLLITQSYGKISPAIRDLVQVVYRCKKATAFGSNDKYIRKVQDGLRGEVVNTTIRDYESKYFPLYKSHTKSNGAVIEALANDIVPIWKRWPFKGAAICLVVASYLFFDAATGDKPATAPQAVRPQVSAPVAVDVVDSVEPADPADIISAVPRGPEQKIHPYQGYDLYLSALMTGTRETGPYLNGYMTIAQNGQPVRRVSFQDMTEAGYVIRYHSPTVVSVEFQGFDLGYVVSGLPQVSLAGKTPEKVTGI